MKPESEPQTISDHPIIRLLREMQLEAAVQRLKVQEGDLHTAAVEALILEHETLSSRMHGAGEVGEGRRMSRRAAALKGILLHGPDPAKMVAETELPEGYVGKILMVSLTGGGFEDAVCLRSGDAWHREILHNTRAEIADLGFPGAEVHPIGGACAGFDADGSIAIWGTSDEYGCCDKELAARMIGRAYPVKLIRILD
jgi:hypothetical protein